MRRFVLLPVLPVLLLLACGNPAVSPSPATSEVALAKAPSLVGSVTLADATSDVYSDGKGIYTHGICGVVVSGPTSGGVSLTPAGGTAGGCLDYPRKVNLRWALRHVSDSPQHVDEAVAETQNARFNVVFGSAGAVDAAVINGGTRCYYRQRNGSYTGKGLRFEPSRYPQSDGLRYDVVGTNTWHVYSRPYPDNVAYCEGDAGISLWHVNVDFVTSAQ